MSAGARSDHQIRPDPGPVRVPVPVPPRAGSIPSRSFDAPPGEAPNEYADPGPGPAGLYGLASVVWATQLTSWATKV